MEDNFYSNLLGTYYDEIIAVISKDGVVFKRFADLVAFNFLWHPLERDKALRQYKSNPVMGCKTFVFAIRTFMKRTRNPERAFCNLLKILNRFKQFDDIIKGINAALVQSNITLPLYEEPTPSNAAVEGTTSPAAASQSLPLDLTESRSIKKYANHLKYYYPKIHATSKWSPAKCDEKMLQYVALEIVANESAGSSMTYDDFFDSGLSCKPSSWILIEGIPGIGKSTLAKEICERWGAGHLEFALVLLLQLRLPEVQDNWFPDIKGIRELIGIHLEGQSWKEEVIQDIIDSSGNGLLVILEGFDELQVGPEEISKQLKVLLKLKRCLSCATVVITTRPGLVYRLKETVLFTKHFRIIGFNEQSQDWYINTFFGCKKDSKKSFKDFIDKNPLISECLRVPLNLLIMLDIFNNKECNCYHDRLPETTTELYETLVMGLIRLELKNCGSQETQFSSLDELPRSTFEKFRVLCGIAYYGVLEQKLVFLEPSNYDTLGLMQKESKFYLSELGSVVHYSFYHLTIQEFLAAYYIFRKKGDIQSHFDQYNNEQSMLVTMRFLAGLTKLHNIHIEIPNDIISSVNIFHQLVEVKDDSLASKILSEKEITVARTTQASYTKQHSGSSLRTKQPISSVLTNHEFYLMGKYIALSSSTWKLGFTLRGLTKDHVKMLLNGFKLTNSSLSCSIEHVKFSLNPIGNEGVASILDLPSQVLSTIKEFFLRGTSLNKDDIFEQWIPSIEHLASLNKFLFHDNNFQEDEQQQLVDALCKLNKLSEVSFSSLSPNECSVILAQFQNLKKLELYELSLPSIGATLASLHECKTLECIELRESQITQEVIENNLHKSLPHSTLKTIMLINCGIDSNTAIAIIDTVTLYSRTVQTLDLSDNVIDDEGVSCIAKQMGEIFKSQENPKRNITQLYLYRNSFTRASIKEFIDELNQGCFPNDFLIHISLQWKDMIETSLPHANNHFRFEGVHHK